MNKYILIFGIILLALIGSVNAWSTNSFNNSLTSSFESGYDNGWAITSSWGTHRNNSWSTDGNWNIFFSSNLGDSLYNSNANLSYYHYLVVDYNVSSVNEGMKTQICDSCFAGCTNINVPSTYIYGNEVGTKIINLSAYSGNKCVLLATGYNFGGGAGLTYLQLDNVRLMTDSDYQVAFTGNQNITRYLSVPSNTLLTNAFLNLTGSSNNQTNDSTIYEYIENASNYSSNMVDPYNGNDTNFSTYTIHAGIGEYLTYENYTIPSHAKNGNNSIYRVKAQTSVSNTGVVSCKNRTDWTSILSVYEMGPIDRNISIPSECMGNNILELKTSIWNFQAKFYEGGVYFGYNYPTNFSLSIGSNNGFNQSGTFNTTNKTSNLASIINLYLTTCTYSNGFCLVPFIFYSDTVGIINYNNLIFDNTGYSSNGQIYNNNTYETAKEYFILNISYDPNYYQSVTANLIYNGSLYNSISTTNGANTIFNSSVDIPIINTSSVNYSFYWNIALANSSGVTYVNISALNQTVNQISLGVCNGTTNILALNITAYNQDDLSVITNWNIKSTLNYYIDNSSFYRTFNLTNLSIAEQDICINANTTFHVTGQLEYSVNSSYQTSNYYFVNQHVSNLTTNLSLGLLPITSTTVFIVKLLDQYNLPVSGYYINIDRYYPGLNEYRTVQTLKTDSNGQSVGFIEINNIQYRFTVKDTSGNVVYTSDTRVIMPQSSPYTITINIISPNPNVLSTNRTISGLSWSISFDKNTKLVTYAYADTNASFTKAELLVYKVMGSTNTLICGTNLTTPNGVITCNLSNYTGSFNAIVYDYRDVQYYVDNLLFDIGNFNAGNLGIFGGICILLICGFAFSFNSLAGIFSLDVGIIAVNLLGLINFGWVTIGAIVCISIVIAIVLERD